jgi:hypothetical protein
MNLTRKHCKTLVFLIELFETKYYLSSKKIKHDFYTNNKHGIPLKNNEITKIIPPPHFTIINVPFQSGRGIFLKGPKAFSAS